MRSGASDTTGSVSFCDSFRVSICDGVSFSIGGVSFCGRSRPAGASTSATSRDGRRDVERDKDAPGVPDGDRTGEDGFVMLFDMLFDILFDCDRARLLGGATSSSRFFSVAPRSVPPARAFFFERSSFELARNIPQGCSSFDDVGRTKSIALCLAEPSFSALAAATPAAESEPSLSDSIIE